MIGVVLSGALDDGTAGMPAIAGRGGLSLVQDPDEALYDGMPTSVLRNLSADHVLPAAKMGALLRDCVGPRFESVDEPRDPARHETAIADAAPAKRFRCHVGHAWTAEALLNAQGETLGKALWTALRTLEETAHAADVPRHHLIGGTFNRAQDEEPAT